MYKKGFTLGDVPGLAIILVIVAVTLGVGSAIVSGVMTGYGNTTFAYNASEAGARGLRTLSSWQPTIALIVAAVVVIGIVSMIKMRE